MTTNYYNQNARTFHADTAGVDMSALYNRFLPLLPAGAHIVDAGCGSGRDALAFHARGYRVTAFDASGELVAIAQESAEKARADIDIQHTTFQSFQAASAVDAIWACASLLHVPSVELPETFRHLAKQLNRGGIFYCSFKYGDSETERAGRRFTNLDETLLQQVLEGTGLQVQTLWVSGDARPGREHEKWLNAILIRCAE